MGFIKFSKGFGLGDKERKSLQKLLEVERKRLLAAIKEIDHQLSMLKEQKQKQKQTKTKSTKKVER